MSLFEEEIPLELIKKYAPAKWAAVSEGIIPLLAADPDFRVAPEIREAAIAAAAEGIYSYTESYGSQSFREIISETLRKRKSIECTPDDVIATSGVAQAMMLVARYSCKPGEEAIIFDPVDFLFGRAIDDAGAKRVVKRVDKKTGELDIEGIKDLISPRTRLFCLCNPHNPLGRVLRREELKAISDLVIDHNLIVMNDEIWSDIVYTGHKHTSLASLGPEIAARTVTLQGFSKTFGLAGLNLGYVVVTDPEVKRGLKRVAPGYFYPLNTISQAAGAAAYSKAWYWAEAFLRHLEEIHEIAYGRLNEIPGVHCLKPEGTYVLFPDISSYGLTSVEMANYLRREAKVGVTPGHGKEFSYFGPAAEGNIRIVFSTTKTKIIEALNRIENALRKLPSRD